MGKLRSDSEAIRTSSEAKRSVDGLTFKAKTIARTKTTTNNCNNNTEKESIIANQTTLIKGAYLDRRLVEEDEEELMRAQRMAAQGDDHLLELLVDCIASRKVTYKEYDNGDEYNYDVMDYYDED